MRTTRGRGVGVGSLMTAVSLLVFVAGTAATTNAQATAAAPAANRGFGGSAGGGFGGVSLPVDLVVGELELRGRRAWVWRVPEPRGPQTIRIVLDQDVETQVGPNRLYGRRAALWLHPVGVGGVGDASGVYEIFGYYEDVESPGGAAGFAFSADALPVQALIATTTPVRLSVDLRLAGPPEAGSEAGAFAARAEASFAEALEAIRDPEAARRRRVAEEEPALPPPAWLLNRDRRDAPTPEPLREVGEQDGAPGSGDGTTAPSTPAAPADQGQVRGDEAGPDPARRDTGGRAIPFSPADDDAARERVPPPPGVPSDEDVVRRAEPGGADGRVAPPADPRASGPAAADADAITGEVGEPVAAAPQVEAPERIFSTSGVFFFSAGDRVTLERGEDANALTLTGGVVVQHEGPERVIEMTARRAVIFTSAGPLGEAFGRFDVSDVIGVYLEGGVRVSDGSYTLRSPRVYYDVRSDRAMLIDAVFRTYDERTRMPLYMRADVVRQEAAKRFSAENAVYANTAFATPHLAIGTSSMTIEERVDAAGDSSMLVDARGITLEGGGVPFFWFPRYKGDPERFPLRSIGLEDTNRTGTVFRTMWDPFALLGIEAPRGLDATFDVDYYTDRGLGLGTEMDWNTPRASGAFIAGLLPDDDGTDVMRNGTEFERENDTRAFAAFRHRWQFRPEWTAWLNGFHASDEKVLPALYRDIGVDTEELTTRAYLRRLENDSLLTLELKGLTTDFLPNEHAAQSPGYAVDKQPEIAFAKVGDDLLEDLAPGYLTHTWHAEASRMRLRFQEITPSDIGLTRRAQSRLAYGIDPDVVIGDSFRQMGMNEEFVNRFDTRHELSSALNVGPVQVTPFAVGRFTAYDTDFEAFSPEENDESRLWGSAGVTFATEIFRVDDSVESRMFDLHRMRHIIEPSLTVWTSGSTIASEDLPVYDDEVEGLAEGTAVRGGLYQTWQTKRGAPGLWRTVDVFTLDIEYAWFSDEVNEETPIGRWFSFRPELSAPDEFVRVAGTWQVTEVVGLTGETVWDAEDEREDRSSAGLILQQGEELAASFEVRQIEAQNDTYGDATLAGTFGDKYLYALRGTYNFRVEDFQNVTFTLLRRFPNGMLGASLSYNNISGETSFGFVVRPTGSRGGALGGIGSGQGSQFGG